ncbi:hypothetical protein ACQUJS_05295 [Ralstonia pseudosolanacearum]
MSDWSMRTPCSRRNGDAGCSTGKIIAIGEASMPRRHCRDGGFQALAARGDAHAMLILKIKINNPQMDKL